MPRVKKSTEATPAPSAKPAKKLAKKPVKKTAEVKPPATPVETTSVEVAADEPLAPQLTQEFTDFMAKLQQINTLLSSLKTEFRSLEKKALRELKAAQKANAKRKRKQGNRSPSGFVKPCLISDELASFLNKPNGVEMARTEVTREINAYIRQHNLQDKANGRKINADAKLSKLLNLKPQDELTYFNLQRYMSPHFQKAAAAAAAAAAAKA
jgi:upstream activation factor subunit UAF30